MFGDRDERVMLAEVPAVVENCVHVLPPFRLYCQMSEVAEEEPDILNPLAVMPVTEHETVGALRSIELSVTEADAVIVPMDTPE